jgi:precorrin-6B methylase 2
MGASLRGEIRSTLLQALTLLDAPKTVGWRHTDRALLQAQGDASMGLVPVLKMGMIPAMGDLASRFEGADARFLDVGVGVASLSIAMCRAFPSLKVVGVDSSDVPLAIARENVERAGLGERISLVQSAIESLSAEHNAAFDLAWLPTFFIADEAIAGATKRAHDALKPGGWILYPAASAQHQAVFGVVTDLWGGTMLSVERATALLAGAGFTSVRTIPGPPWAPGMLVGQRANQ